MKKKLAVLLSAALLALGVPVGLGVSAADFVPDFLCTYPAEGSELEMEAFDISWEPVDGAVKYQVNLKNTDTGEYVLELVETNGTSISAPRSWPTEAKSSPPAPPSPSRNPLRSSILSAAPKWWPSAIAWWPTDGKRNGARCGPTCSGSALALRS